MKRKLFSALSLAVIFSLLISSLALADTVQPDNDFVTAGNQTTISLGNVAPGATLTPQVSFTLVCAGTQHVDDPQSVSIVYTSAGSSFPAGGSLGASPATIGAASGLDPGVPAAGPSERQCARCCGTIRLISVDHARIGL